MSNIPKSWIMVEVGELCELVNGRAFKTSEWSEKGLPIIRIQNLNNSKSNYNYFDGDLSDKHLVKKDDLLFAWSGTPGTSFGSHVWKGDDAALNQHIFKINFPRELLDADYLQYAINQTLDELIGKARGGVGLRHITKKIFEKTELVLISLDEQKEMVFLLNRLFQKIDDLEFRIDATLDIIKYFRESVLNEMVNGTLIERSNKSYKTRQLIDLCERNRVITYGVIKLGSHVDNGIPCLRTSNVRWLSIETKGVKKISPEISKEYSRTLLKGGEVLVNVRGTLGGVAVVQKSMKNWNISREVAIVPIDESIALSEFVSYSIASKKGQNQLNSLVKGVAYMGINIRDLRSFCIDIPTLIEQKKIIKKVDSYFKFADIVENQLMFIQKKINDLKKNVLTRAFKGELTAEWRTKNPELITGEDSAKKILEKIKIKREQKIKANNTKYSNRKRKSNTRQKKVIIPILETLEKLDRAVSTSELLIQSGYPQDASAEKIEDFFLDIRQQIADKKISCERKDNEDHFMLINKVNKQ